MPIIITKVVVISVTIKVGAMTTAGKIAIKLGTLAAAIASLASIVSDIRSILNDLIEIRGILFDVMGGQEADTFFREYDQYCDAVREMGDCIDGCRTFLQQSHDEYEAAQAQSRNRANELSNTRARG